MFFQVQTKGIKTPVVLIIPLQPTRNKSMDSIFHRIMTISCTELDELIYYSGKVLIAGPFGLWVQWHMQRETSSRARYKTDLS